MLCEVKMKNKLNVTQDLTFQVEQVIGKRKTESDFMKKED